MKKEEIPTLKDQANTQKISKTVNRATENLIKEPNERVEKMIKAKESFLQSCQTSAEAADFIINYGCTIGNSCQRGIDNSLAQINTTLELMNSLQPGELEAHITFLTRIKNGLQYLKTAEYDTEEKEDKIKEICTTIAQNSKKALLIHKQVTNEKDHAEKPPQDNTSHLDYGTRRDPNNPFKTSMNDNF